jgi:CBS domain-containing protein
MRCPSCGQDNLPGADECASCLHSLMQEDVPQPATAFEATLMHHSVAAICQPEPEMVVSGTPLAQAIARMQAKNVGYVLITSGDGKLTGIFTEHDLLRKVVGQNVNMETTPVESVMTRNPTTLKSSEPIAQALHLMAVQPGYRHIPLVDDDGRPTGLISFRRIARFIEDRGAH